MNPIEAVIDGYKALATLLDSPAQRAGAMLTAQLAEEELKTMRAVAEAAQTLLDTYNEASDFNVGYDWMFSSLAAALERLQKVEER